MTAAPLGREAKTAGKETGLLLDDLFTGIKMAPDDLDGRPYTLSDATST